MEWTENNKATISRESTADNIGHLTMVIEDYVLLEATPKDYLKEFKPEAMERFGGSIGAKLMSRFNDKSRVQLMISTLMNGLPERTDIFGLEESEAVVKGIEPALTKKIARFMLTDIHKRLNDKENLKLFVTALKLRLSKM